MQRKNKLLVANRGEIACRIFQAAKEMGMDTVAIYVEGDEQSRHITFADEVYKIDRYLNAEAIVQVANDSGARFIHPGYGFLSERSHFVRAVEAAGLVFLGPRAETMDALGGKIAAKELAESLNIPTIPWAKVEKGQDLVAAAKKVGFPLLLKAHAGGGGKGMRKIYSEKDLMESAEAAAREAEASFGDATVFLEKLIERARHIEVQVFGDGRGGGVHYFERECSLQRRHQKILEEAPAPRLRPETKKGLHECSLNLVQHTKYRSAGTIEFLVDQNENFYFIEMNTRLQVEHPVTEIVSGTDLVHEQIRLALNPDTYVCQQVQHPIGHAIEVRICAENPDQEFAPCTGTVQKLIWPMGPGIRVDSGIEEGQVIGTQFDSMLAKVIVSAPDREMALKRLKFALGQTLISGVGTNVAALERLTEIVDVQESKVDTEWISRNELGSPKWNPDLDENAAILNGVVSAAVLNLQGSAEVNQNRISNSNVWSKQVWKGARP